MIYQPFVPEKGRAAFEISVLSGVPNGAFVLLSNGAFDGFGIVIRTDALFGINAATITKPWAMDRSG